MHVVQVHKKRMFYEFGDKKCDVSRIQVLQGLNILSMSMLL